MRPTKSTLALIAALLLALLTLALSPAREGAKLLINDLFSLSESANAYVYDRLPVAAGASRLPACALLGGALAFLSAAVVLSQSRLPALRYNVNHHVGRASPASHGVCAGRAVYAAAGQPVPFYLYESGRHQ